MTLQASGAISLANLATEFGGAQPHSMNEYYAGGGLTPSGTSGVPTSGQISLSQFYGTTAIVIGQVAYTNTGTYTWICPQGVTSVSVVCIGGGSSGGVIGYPYGGQGGALGYKNSIPVTPGTAYKIVVGGGGQGTTAYQGIDPGGESWFGRTYVEIETGTTYYTDVAFVGANGGASNAEWWGAGPFSYTFNYPYSANETTTSDPDLGGGRGGNVAYGNYSFGAGGGGTGGYGGLGFNTWANVIGGSGAGPDGQAGNPTEGSGGGGGGGSSGSGGWGYDGGGVGILGKGSDGVAGAFQQNGTPGSGGFGQYYGGAGGGFNGEGLAPRSGASGAVRIIWPGNTRQFPTTNTGNL